MAVTIEIFILFLGVVIVKSHHLHLHQHRHRHHFLDNIFHAIGDGFFGNGDSQSDGLYNDYYGDMGQEINYAPSNTGMDYQDYGQYDDYNMGVNIPDHSNGDIGLPNGSQTPDDNFDIAVPNEPKSSDANFNTAVPNGRQPRPNVDFNTAVPNGRQPRPNVDFNTAVPNVPQPPDVHFNIAVPNKPQSPDVHLNIAVPNNPHSPDVHFNIAVPNAPQTPDVHVNIAIPSAIQTPIAVPNEPPISDVQGLNSPANEGSVNNLNEPHHDSNVLDNHVDINQSQNRVPDNVEIPNINADAGQKTVIGIVDSSGSSDQNNLEEKNLVAKNVPGFTDDDIKKGIVIADPEFKNNINEAHESKISDEAQGQLSDVEAGLNAPAVVDLNLQNKKEDEKDDSIGNKSELLGFNDDHIQKGVLLVDPELKYNTNENYKIIVPDFNDTKESIHNNDETENPDDFIENKKNIPELTGDNITKEISTDEPKLSHNIDELQSSKNIEQTDDKRAVPEINDDDIKKGTLMIDPELKNNETDVGLDKFSDAVVFPDDVDEAKKQHQVNTDDKQSLPNRFSAGENNKEYNLAIAPVVALTTLSASNYNPSQSITPNNNEQTSSTWNNQGTQNQYTKPNSGVFGQSINQQVPVNNGNGSPYVNVVRNPNGEYTVVNIPNNNNGQSPSQVYVSANSGVNKPGQSYVFANSGVNNPSQSYVSVNSGINNPGQSYVSGNTAANNPVLSYVSSGSGLNNPGPAYIPVNVNSGVTNPGQIYVVTDGGNSQFKNPGQHYVSGINNQGQIYVPVNSGANNPGQIYIPSSGSQTTSGGYYTVIQLSNGQSVLVPVNGNGQNTQWNGQSNNGQTLYVPVQYNPGQGYQTLGNNPVVTLGISGISGSDGTSGTTNKVPLLISYKDKDGEDDEKSTTLDQDDKKEEKEE